MPYDSYMKLVQTLSNTMRVNELSFKAVKIQGNIKESSQVKSESNLWFLT